MNDDYQYTYDADGNVTSKANVLDSSFTENYTYDGLARLTAVSRGTDSSYQSFGMNSIGDINSVTTDGTTSNRTANSENQITAIDGNAITYDNNGNVTTDDHGDTLEYDAWNRLVAVYNSSGALIAGYTYDGLGRMTSETDITTTTDLYYSGTQEIEDRTGVTDYTGASLSSNGSTTVVNVYSPDYVNDILLRDTYVGGSFSSRVYFTHDANYNVTGVVNGTTSTMLQRMVYDAYGAVTFYNASWTLQSGDSLNLRNLYQGMRFDPTIGWYFSGESNVARWYSPTMQIWNREDSDGGVNGLNEYGFVAGNPINLVDPFGLAATAPASAPAVLVKISVRLGAEIPLHGLNWSDWDVLSDNTKGAKPTVSVEGDSPEFKTTVNWIYAKDDPSLPGHVYGNKDYTYELAVKLELITGPCSRVKGTISAKDITIDYHLSHSPAGKKTWTLGEHSNGTIKAGWTTTFDGGSTKATKSVGTFSYGGPFSIVVDHVEGGWRTDDRYQSTTAGTIAINGTYFTK